MESYIIKAQMVLLRKSHRTSLVSRPTYNLFCNSMDDPFSQSGLVQVVMRTFFPVGRVSVFMSFTVCPLFLDHCMPISKSSLPC